VFGLFDHLRIKRLDKALKALESCDMRKLPKLVISDDKVTIENGGLPNTRFLTRIVSNSTLLKEARTITLNHCNEVAVVEEQTSIVMARGFQFWHDNGKHYVYWAYLHPESKSDHLFSRRLREQLARQGLERQRFDEFRIQDNAGRIYQLKSFQKGN